MTRSIMLFFLIVTFHLLVGCDTVPPLPEPPTLPPAPTVATVMVSISTPESSPTLEVIENYTFPHVSASLYGDAGNFALQAGVLSKVSWVDAPPEADYYDFTLKLPALWRL